MIVCTQLYKKTIATLKVYKIVPIYIRHDVSRLKKMLQTTWSEKFC